MSDDRVKTTVLGHRDARYQGEPKSRREIHRLDEKIPLSGASSSVAQR